ncbi:1-propanol dehydrogenase PduQ [Pseudoflavonifractor phocaeensis]|uniref:1-propanol dehydrogenase PduQ n=1 Tax=Pseudoflavonifractor phocaeensis TaxID=1870988 RepID=UPI0019576CD2|nr:1-propanol dehydrogenase PduQ [Pseudoflavonifractor phocaeensis]MBM6722248.1 iron-containing alcohol dehydrogenase [Pseudoflavonifractor phocaeensis]
MKEFSFSTRIFFGEGALERLRKVEDKRVMIVTDRFMANMGVPDKVAGYLTRCQVSVFDGVVPDPPIEVVAAGVQALQESGAEAMIAVGGGSTIDAAKAIRAVAKETLHIDTDRWECFAVPTTSGTGSEVTEYAVITDRAKGIKYPLDSKALRPPVAILDPQLTVSAPASVTADAGMDVLTHAIEAYVSKGANDFSDALCEKAVSLVFRFLPLAFQDGTDLLAREKMHNASCMAGLAFNSAGLGLTHGMAHAVGGKLHIPHGRINAMLLPHIIQFNANLAGVRGGEYALAAKKYQRLAKTLDLPAPSVRLGVSNLLREVEHLNRVLKIPATLKEWGGDLEQVKQLWDEMVSAALADVTTSTNPRPATAESVSAILQRLMGK